MKTIAISLLLFFLTLTAHGQSAGDFDGRFWLQLTYEAKVVFIVGMAHGELSAFQTLFNMEETAILDALVTKLNDQRTIDKTIAAIDRFYKDNPKDIEKPVFIVYLFTLEASKID